MFFDANLLCRTRQGKFAIIWLAATRGVKIFVKNEVDSVDVVHICGQLLEYIMSTSTSPKGRISLRLSAKLMVGIVLIYRQQIVNFEKQVMLFNCTVRRPRFTLSVDEHPFLVPEIPKKRKRKSKKSVQPAENQLTILGPVQDPTIEFQTSQALREIFELQEPSVQTVSIEQMMHTVPEEQITLREDVPGPVEDQQVLFGDEDDFNMQLAILDANFNLQTLVEPSFGVIPDHFVVNPEDPATEKRKITSPETLLQSPMKKRRGESSRIIEIHQPETPDNIQQAQVTLEETVGEPCQNGVPVSRVTFEEIVEIPQQSGVAPAAHVVNVEVPQVGAVGPMTPEFVVPPPRRPRRRRSLVQDLVTTSPTRWSANSIGRIERSFDINASPSRWFSGRQRALEVRPALSPDIKELVTEILAGVQLTDEDLASVVVRDVREKPNTLSVSGPGELTNINEFQGETLPPVREQEENIPDIQPQPIMDMQEETVVQVHQIPSPRLSRILLPDEYNSISEVALPAATRETHKQSTDTLRQFIHAQFQRNGFQPLTIEELCFPLNRLTVTRTFNELLHLAKEQYIILETQPDSLELNLIKPGPRLLKK